MPPFQQYSRVDIQDLKAQMVKRVGPEKANQYFNIFKGYISSKCSKMELDKLVVLAIGKENIGLHNQIIKAILSNAIKSDSPPPPSAGQDMLKPVKGVRGKPLLQFAISNDASRNPVVSTDPIWTNGAICGGFPRKERGLSLDQTISKDKGKLSSTHIDGTNYVVDLDRPGHVEGSAELLKNDGSVHLCKRPRIIIPSSPDMGMSKSERDLLSPSRVADSRHGEPYQQWGGGRVKISLGAPLLNLSSASKLPLFGLAGSSYLQMKDAEQNLRDSSDLPSVALVQRHMEHIAELEGLEGVSEKCAELLNEGIDIFLKGLIRSCIDFVKNLPQKKSRPMSLHAANAPKAIGPYNSGKAQSEFMGEDLIPPTISFLELKSAMDFNPQQLGHNWPLQLERFQLYSLD